MPGVLLQQMRKDPAKDGWIAGEPATQSAPIGQLRLPGNRLGTGSDCGQSCRQVGNIVLRQDEPTLPARILITSGIRRLLGLEAPLHPTPLNEDQVLEQSQRRPT
jgi:hypothetical protein